jgi:hypothetical protein
MEPLQPTGEQFVESNLSPEMRRLRDLVRSLIRELEGYREKNKDQQAPEKS